MKSQTTNHQHLTDKSITRQDAKSIRGIFIPIFKKHKTRLIIGFAALLGVDFLQLLVPIILKNGVDSLEMGTASTRTLLFLSGAILLVGAGSAVFRFCWRYCIIGFSNILEYTIRTRLYKHILSLDRPFFDKKTTGDIMAHAGNDLSAVQMACGMGLVAAVDALVISLASVVFMININPKLTLMALLPMPLLAILTRRLSHKLHHKFDLVQNRFSLLTEFARNAMVSIRLVKAYTLEQQQQKLFQDLGADYMRNNMQVAVIHGLLLNAATLLSNVGILIILFYGGYLTIIKSISIGDFVAFVTYLQMLIWPMMAVGWVANITQRGLTSMRRINTIFNVASGFNSSPEAQETNQTADNSALFSCNDLDFVYPGKEEPTLKKFSFTTNKKIIGIAGRTGSGKSTLCKVLTRMYGVDDGRLFLNGKDVNSLEVDFVRSQVAFVGQEPILFSDTITANMLVGNPDATSEELISAAKAASLHEEIIMFPDKYETLIGEKGTALSGGQKQRLAIARALLSHRPLLLLDDVFSTVDVETEQQIITGILNHFQGNTVIFISNRAKLLTLAEEVCFLEDGEINDRGSHAELFGRCVGYNSMIRGKKPVISARNRK